jgi:hypothetical protein
MALRDSARPSERVGILNLWETHGRKVNGIEGKALRFLEGGYIVEDLGQDEIEEGPKLCQIVLQRQ